MTGPRLRSLFQCLGEVPECRHGRGKRHPLNTVPAVAVAARGFPGTGGATAFARFAALLSRQQLEAVGAFRSPPNHSSNRCAGVSPSILSRNASRRAPGPTLVRVVLQFREARLFHRSHTMR